MSKGNRGGNAGDISNLVPPKVKVSKVPAAPSNKAVNVKRNEGGKGIGDISELPGLTVEKPPAIPKDQSKANRHAKVDGGDPILT